MSKFYIIMYPQTWNSTKNIVLINYIPEVWNSLIVAWNPNSPSKPCRQNVNHTKCDFWIFAPFSDLGPKDSYHSCCISNILHDSDCFHINLASLEKVEFYLKKRVLLISFKNHNVTIMCCNDEVTSTMSWVGFLLKDSELFVLFAKNSQILLKL